MNQRQLRELLSSSRALAMLWTIGLCTTAQGQDDLVKKTGWSSSIAVGANMATGNSRTRGLTGSLNGETRTDQYEFRLSMEGNYGKTKVQQKVGGVTTTIDDTSAENAKASVNSKLKFDRNYMFSDNSIFHDGQADINSRLVLGAQGVGRYLVDNKLTRLATDVGVAYVREDVATKSEVDNSPAYRVSSRLDQKLSDTSKLWASVEYLPEADDLNDYLCSGEAGAEAALNARLSLRAVVQDRYDSLPSADRERNDLLFTSSIVYKF